MNMNWQEFVGSTLNVIMKENYGMVRKFEKESPDFFEIVFKSGKLTNVYSDGLFLETTRENHRVRIFIPFQSIKCVEIFDL